MYREGDRERAFCGRVLAELCRLMVDPQPTLSPKDDWPPRRNTFEREILSELVVETISVSVEPDALRFAVRVRTRTTPPRTGVAWLGIASPLPPALQDADAAEQCVWTFIVQLHEDLARGTRQHLVWDEPTP